MCSEYCYFDRDGMATVFQQQLFASVANFLYNVIIVGYPASLPIPPSLVCFLQLGQRDNPAVDPIIQGLKRVVHHGE